MSIQSEINRIKENIVNAYNKLEEKGAFIPKEKNTANLTNTIDSISTGEGGGVNLDSFISGSIPSVTSNLTAIPDFAFAGKKGLITANLPEATYIGKYAFSAAAASSISESGSSSASDGEEELPPEEEDDSLVWHNKNLTTVNMPKVTQIEEGAFEDAQNLTIRELPESLIVIKDRAFKNCPNVQLTNLPSELTYIGNDALELQENFPFDDVSETIKYLGSGFTFEQLREYISQFITFENGVLDLSRVPAFWIDVSISTDITQGRNVFTDNIQNVQSIVFPDSVTSIGDYAFGGCNALTSLTIPDSVTSIGDYAFGGCQDLTSLTIPDSVTSIGSSAFDGCNALTSLTIPDSVTSIGDYAFGECQALTSLTIPDSVTSIDAGAFHGCRALTSLTIGDSVTSIDAGAFYGCQALTSLTIPDSVTTIDVNAFHGCQALTSLTIGDGVTSIGDYAFGGCNALTSLTIPDSVTSIGNNAFRGCQALGMVDMTAFDGSNIPKVQTQSFYANSHSENFAFAFKSQEVLNAFASASNWANYADYFVVQE